MSNEGNLSIHSTLDIGIQENLKVELCMWKYTMTSTGKEVKLAEVTAWPACEPELESSNMSAGSAAGWPAAAASADVSLTLKVGMGSRACSRNSNMLGVIMVSSGILCKVIQADNWALLAPYFLPVIVKIGINERFRPGVSISFFLWLLFSGSQLTLLLNTLCSSAHFTP